MITAETGFGSVGLFLGDEAEGRTGDQGQEDAEDKRSNKKCLDQTVT